MNEIYEIIIIDKVTNWSTNQEKNSKLNTKDSEYVRPFLILRGLTSATTAL